jgi:LPXTG-motif cell wall-anchored protein
MLKLILKQALCIALIVFFISSGVPLAKSQTQGCATYQTNLLIDLDNSIPTHVAVGGTVVTKVHVIYPDGTPVVLSPETISFLWSGITSQKTIENAPVVPTGDPGFYLYTQSVTADFPTGTVTIYAVWCSCSDVAGNYGPPSNTSSETTITPADNSIVAIGPITPTGPPTAQQLFSTYGVPVIIALLLLAALLLFLARRKKKR